jgi:hypothetical protein
MNKLTEEELKSLQESIGKLNEFKIALADATTQKHLLQVEVLKHNETLSGIQRGLESKYGNITVDIETGEYDLQTEEQTEDG